MSSGSREPGLVLCQITCQLIRKFCIAKVQYKISNQNAVLYKHSKHGVLG